MYCLISYVFLFEPILCSDDSHESMRWYPPDWITRLLTSERLCYHRQCVLPILSSVFPLGFILLVGAGLSEKKPKQPPPPYARLCEQEWLSEMGQTWMQTTLIRCSPAWVTMSKCSPTRQSNRSGSFSLMVRLNPTTPLYCALESIETPSFSPHLV